mgnify:CR=1 FL=1
MVESSIVFGVLFLLLCGLLAIVHSMKVRSVTLLDWTLLAMGGMYGFGWIVVHQITQSGANPVWEHWILPFEGYYPLHSLASLLLLAGVLAGWYLLAPIWRGGPPYEMDLANWQLARWARSFWGLLGLGVLAQAIYAHAYGGLLGQLEYSGLIRSSHFDAVPSNSFSFLKPVGGLVLIAAFGFFGLLLSRHRSFSVRLGFVLAFLDSLFVLFTWLGRMGFLVFLASFLLAFAMHRIRSPMLVVAGGGIVFSSLLVGAYGVSVWLDLKAADNLMTFLAKELAFPFGSFYAQLAHGEQLFRGFVDFIWTPAYLLPSSWWTNWIEPVNQVNTAVVMGAPKGEGGVTSGIPVDLLTLGVMQLHLPGVMLTGMLFGVLLRAVHTLLRRINCRGIRLTFEANISLSVATLGVFYSQPNLMISANIHWIMAAIIMTVLLRLPTLRMRDSHYRATERTPS